MQSDVNIQSSGNAAMTRDAVFVIAKRTNGFFLIARKESDFSLSLAIMGGSEENVTEILLSRIQTRPAIWNSNLSLHENERLKNKLYCMEEWISSKYILTK